MNQDRGIARDILHVHVPAFAVAVARMGDSSLRQRPVAVALPGGRSVLLAVSPEARQEGVYRGMGSAWAQRCCPGLRIVSPEPEATARVGQALADVAGRHTPLWESPRPGHIFLDLNGSGRLLGPPRDVAARVEKELARQLSLPGSVGVGGNKLVARVASHFLVDGGVCDVLRGTEQGFLEPLPLDLLPGLGEVRRRVLEDWGVVHIGELAGLPRSHLVAVFGAFGATLQVRAQGEDWEPVFPAAAQPGVEEGEALPRDSADPEELVFYLRRLTERACFRLRAADQVAGSVVVRVRYADGRTAHRTGRLAPRTSWDHEVLPVVQGLFIAAFARRVRVRGLGVGLFRLSGRALQLDLFRSPPRERRHEALCQAVDNLRRRYGFDAVAWGAVSQPRET